MRVMLMIVNIMAHIAGNGSHVSAIGRFQRRYRPILKIVGKTHRSIKLFLREFMIGNGTTHNTLGCPNANGEVRLNPWHCYRVSEVSSSTRPIMHKSPYTIGAIVRRIVVVTTPQSLIDLKILHTLSRKMPFCVRITRSRHDV